MELDQVGVRFRADNLEHLILIVDQYEGAILGLPDAQLFRHHHHLPPSLIRGEPTSRSRGRGGSTPSPSRPLLRCNGDPSLVEVDELAIHAALVEVAAGRLDPGGVSDAARLQRLEAGST